MIQVSKSGKGVIAVLVISALVMSTVPTTLAQESLPERGTNGETGIQEPTGTQGDTGRIEDYDPTSAAETPAAQSQSVSDPSPTASTQSSANEPTATSNSTSPAVQGPSSSQASELNNEATGPNSLNENATSTDTTAAVERTNNATIDNAATINASTGSNAVTSNSRVGDIESGNVDGTATVVNVANSEFAEGSSIGSQTLDPTATSHTLTPTQQRALLNRVTGPDSENANSVSGSNTIQVVDTNTADVTNDLTVVANTGDNIITSNTAVGDVATGDINLALNMINLLNIYAPNTLLAVDVWSILSDYTGDLVFDLGNSATGPNSENTNSATANRDVSATVTNRSEIDNVFDIDAATGDNELEGNTAVGNVTTGGINIEGAVTNIANTVKPILYIVNVFGEWAGELMGVDPSQVIVNRIDNQATGPNSENTNNIDQNQTIDLDVTNEARVRNRINVDANTGSNTFANNTLVGNITTGSINIMANVYNVLNSWGGDLSNFRLGIVNIFGNWKGNATSSKGSPTMAESTPDPVAVGGVSTGSGNTATESTSHSSSPLAFSFATPLGPDTDERVSATAEREMTRVIESTERVRRRISTGFGGITQSLRDAQTSSQAESESQLNNETGSDLPFRTKLVEPNSPQQSGLIASVNAKAGILIALILALWGVIEYLAARKNRFPHA